MASWVSVVERLEPDVKPPFCTLKNNQTNVIFAATGFYANRGLFKFKSEMACYFKNKIDYDSTCTHLYKYVLIVPRTPTVPETPARCLSFEDNNGIFLKQLVA